jgi:isoaspartyl peptidase/L-asparaginase-like protein (Ntn-hydrolase superfamily)
MGPAVQVLRAGGTALDALEAGIRAVESNAQDESVGLGGLPNALGQVELDASIMDGRTLASGAVGALQGYEHPISVARRVMQLSPHVLLVGEGAQRFAAEVGMEECKLLTEEARRKWRERLLEFIPEAEFDRISDRERLMPLVADLAGMRLAHGTVNFLALDRNGDIACGVSTSGWPWKYPGRLGDSPIIGAGNYADNRYGAAACTGYGELTIRCGTARSVVLYMKMGLAVEEACREAMADLQPLLAAHGGAVNLLAIDKHGHPFGITNAAEDVPFWVMTPESTAPEQRASLRTSRSTPGVSPQAE